MDIFEKIDWHPPLSDIVDEVFINIDRLDRESSMYNIIRGSYVDPLKDIYKDNYDSIKEEDIQYVKEQSQEKSKAMRAARNLSVDNSVGTLKRPDIKSQDHIDTPYIPGVFKKPYKFPRLSSLSAAQHALCLKIIVKFSRSEKPGSTTKKDINELQTYVNLQSTISQEQDEYLELAKQHWDDKKITVIREDLIDLKWQQKLKQLQNIHKFYNEIGTIAFNSQQKIHVNFESTVLETGKIPKLKLPILHHRFIFNVNNPKIKKKYFSNTKLQEENYINHDVNCNKLAEEHNIDLVISSSGLKCLATNLNPNPDNSWILPIVIKNYNSRNIIFIDKPLPSTEKNAAEKNAWMYKYLLKVNCLQLIPDKKSGFISQDDEENDDDKADDNDTNADKSSKITMKKNDRNHQYNIFTIGACGEMQNELMKDKIKKDYKILVRTKIDAIEKLENDILGCVKVFPKLEHQTPLGAEIVTLDEAAKQWITLTFTPNAYGIRVRIDEPTSEYLQIERRTTASINNELNRLHNIKGENILIFIYNIIENMREMSPGRYILKHTLRNGVFASLYRETDNPGQHTLNLDNIYCDKVFQTKPNVPWIPLDKMVPTPATKFFNRVPLMFYPKKIDPKLNAAQKKQQKSKNKKKNIVQLQKNKQIK